MEFSRLQEELEAVSRAYAKRYGIERTDDWLILELNEEVGELTQAYLARSGQSRDKGKALRLCGLASRTNWLTCWLMWC